jgi:serine/threonine protein kinase
MSIQAGLPSWSGLKESLLEVLEGKAVDLEPRDARDLRNKAEAIRRQQNLWVAFKMLQEGLGKTTYRESIRNDFASAPTVEVPNIYRRLWELRVRGILNLNLDRLATRAHSEYRPGAALAEFSGSDVSRLRQLLNGHQAFVGNMHGVFEDSKSLFTKNDLDTLLKQEAYRSFIELCLSTHAILFLGLSTDDTAVGGHLERLAALGIETPAHYWLTERRDSATDKWAEDAGVRVIRYDGTSEHAGVIEFFHDLSTYLPEEAPEAFRPIAPSGELAPEPDASPPSELPPMSDLLQMNAEEIRRALNQKANELLHGEDKADFDAYEDFSQKYGQAIYRAWYTSTEPEENVLLGYKLKREVAEGSFGRVYAAEAPAGGQVAVKVLLGEVRTKPELLRSFRRGVRSMKILHDRRVDGMVAYLAASEIPAFVVMEWVEGPNLAEATRAGYLGNWNDLLDAAVQLSQIVRRAHELPERVLHRDLRPSNVMLRGYYADPEAWTVVVLDFDLSWHRGAFEQSVVHTSAAGYLAPEQMRPIPNVSTRNAAVDSFGLGMTLFYLCSGEDPSPDQHRHEDWEKQVRDACMSIGKSSWKSAPERVSRLILAATQDSQAARWDMAEITGELERLSAAVCDPGSVDSAELLTEEVASQSDVFADYIWEPDTVRATRELPTGLRLMLSTQLESQRIQLKIAWTSTGIEDRRNLRKYIVAAAKSTVDQLRASGWEEVKHDVGPSAVIIEATIDGREVQGRVSDVAASIDGATGQLKRIGG